jgi:hypothetical protein
MRRDDVSRQSRAAAEADRRRERSRTVRCDVTYSPWIKTLHLVEVCACRRDTTHSPDSVQTFVAAARQSGFRKRHWLEKDELDRTSISEIEHDLLTTLFRDLIFDRSNDPLIHVCDLLSFVGVTAFFAHERIIGEILVAQVNCRIRPRLSPTSQSIKDLSEVYAVQLKMKFFAHNGHNYLARFAANAKSFLVEEHPNS